MPDTDIDWLIAHQPRGLEDPAARDRALAALTEHTTPTRRRPPRLTYRRRLGLVSATGVAAIAAAVGLSLGASAHHTATGAHLSHPVAAIGHHGAAAKSPLIRLAADVKKFDIGTGDATLVARTTATGGQTVTVYDLYTDSGDYFFSPNEDGLAAQVSSDNDLADGLFDREIAAAKEAASGDVSGGAQDMADAADPSQIIPKNEPAAPKAEIIAKQRATGQKIDPNAIQGSRYDNWVWGDSLDALTAGAGQPQVRAGVLAILATLPGVTVTPGTTDGQPSLILTAGADEFGMDYQEQLAINSSTGVPIQFVGGTPGQAPAATVSYVVSRVSTSNLPTS